MPDIGIRELKARASEIVRNVRQRRMRYIITYRGRPVGLLMPLERAGSGEARLAVETDQSAWDDLIRLGKDIGRGWKSPQSSTEILSDMRR
jgi:prevent-host-death family protein